MNHRKNRKPLRRCNKTGLIIFPDELEAKIVLARRVWKDKGEKRTFPCGNHFHLSADDRSLEDGMRAA